MDLLSNLYPTNQIGSDGFSWWLGQIESERKDDEKGSGRYRVRIVGLHPQTCDVVKSEDLPWALTMMPVTNPHLTGGHASVSDQLEPGCWVVGFFLDTDKQQPVIMGTIGRTAGSTDEELPENPTPGESGCKSFTTFLSQNASAADQPVTDKTLAPRTIPSSGHAPDGLERLTESDESLGGKETAVIRAKYTRNTTTNPGGINWCVTVADKCGQESDLKGSLKRIISEMLYEVQQNNGKLGSYLVGEFNNKLYNEIGVGRKHVNKAIRVVRLFVASVKGYVLQKMKNGIRDLTNFLLGVTPEGNSLSGVTLWFNNLLSQLGCSMADLGDRIAKFVEDLLFGYLFQAYKAAACLVDAAVEGILNKIISLIEELLSAVLGPLQDILGAIASAINIVGDALNYVLNLLGISCSGPKNKCAPKKKICTNCEEEKKEDDSDFLDDLLAGIEGMFPNTGEDWSTYICEEGQSGQTLPPTRVVISGGIQIPEANPIIRYTIDDVIVQEGDMATFTVTRSGYTDVASSVSYFTVDGTAVYGSDYERVETAVLGFIPNETKKTISVRTFNDTDKNELDEDFFVVINKNTPGTVTSVADKNIGKCTIRKTGKTITGPVDPGAPEDIVIPTNPVSSQSPDTVFTFPSPTFPSIPVSTDDGDGTDETLAPQYFVSADKSSVKEGDFVTFTITSINVTGNETLEYKMFGQGITSDDIIGSSLTGTFTIVNNKAVVIIGIAEDGVTETQETLTFGIPGTTAQTSVLIVPSSDGEDTDPVNQFDSSSNITEASSPDPISPTAGQVITDDGGSIITIPIDNPGDPYSESPVVFVTGSGYGASAEPLLDSTGRLTEIRVTNPGQGYKLNTPVDAQLECIIDSFTMLSVGSSYKTAPTVYVNGDSSVAEALINEDGQVISVRIKNRELVFDEYPEVLLLGGGGFGARAIPSFACLNPEARVSVGSAKIGTGSYIDCP